MKYQAGPLLRTYGMTPKDWRRVADYFDAHQEPRMAATIASGLGRWKNRERWWIHLRFKDGSIAKMDAALTAVLGELGGLAEDEPEWLKT